MKQSRFMVLSIVLVFLLGVGMGVQSADAKTRVVIAQGVDPTSMDPDMHRETPTDNVLVHIYDPLVQRNNDAKIVPCLAESWKIVNDTTIELKLRKGIKFSNGEPFNAAVVKYNYDRVAGLMPGAKKTLNARDYKSIKEVKVIDDYTAHIITKHPDPLLMAYMSVKLIVPIEYTKKDNFKALANKPVGTGP